MIVHGNINLNTFNAIYSIYRWVRNERKNVRLCYVVGYFASLGPLREKLCCKSLQSCWVFFRPLSPSCICYIIDFSQIGYSPSFNILYCLLDNNTISWSHYHLLAKIWHKKNKQTTQQKKLLHMPYLWYRFELCSTYLGQKKGFWSMWRSRLQWKLFQVLSMYAWSFYFLFWVSININALPAPVNLLSVNK